MSKKIDMTYYANGNRDFPQIQNQNSTIPSAAVKSTASNLMQRNYLDFPQNSIQPQVQNHQNNQAFNDYHPEYKLYRTTNQQNSNLNNYLNPVEQYTYKDNPIIKTGEQLINVQKHQINANLNNNKPQKKDDQRIILKEPVNEAILIPNDFHLYIGNKGSNRIKVPSPNPDMEFVRHSNLLESKTSPEYLRNYDQNLIKNIDDYYLKKGENLQVLSRFGDWITLRPNDKIRSHALERLKHGTYETSIIAPEWMDIQSRRYGKKKEDFYKKLDFSKNNYEYVNKGNQDKNFKSVVFNNNIREKAKKMLLVDRDQKNAKPYIMLDSYSKYELLEKTGQFKPNYGKINECNKQ